ncbi:MAG: hypothetical protein R3F43_26835 [bacterium]
MVDDGDGGQVELTAAVRVRNEIPRLQVDLRDPQPEGAEVVIRAVAIDPRATIACSSASMSTTTASSSSSSRPSPRPLALHRRRLLHGPDPGGRRQRRDRRPARDRRSRTWRRPCACRPTRP